MARVTGHIKVVQRKRGPQWYAKWRDVDGVQHQRRLGPGWTERRPPPDGHLTRRMAQAELEAILTDARRAEPARPGAVGATFADAAAEFLRYVERVDKRDPTTIKDYRSVIDGYLLEAFAGPLAAVTPDTVDEYKERLIAEGRLSNRTIVRHLVVLYGIFKRAKRVWGLRDNPASADLVKRPEVVYTGEFDTYNRDEVLALVAAADDPQDAAVYLTAAYTGLRQGELLALRWRDVDLVDNLLHVRANYTDRTEKVPKGKRVRSVPMMGEVVDALARLKDREHFADDDDLVFCSLVGGFLDSFALRRRFYAAIKRAGLRRIRFHDLRHHFGSLAITVLDPNAVQSYMGHQHYSTTQRYLHHKPRPEHARLLDQAARGRVERAVSGHAGDTLTVADPEPDAAIPAASGESG